jgi:glycosyltransferase involved in cell wall biosynthesis
MSATFSGCVFAATGYGAAARAYIHALHSASIDLSVVNRSTRPQRMVPDPLAISLLNRTVDSRFHLCSTEPCDILAAKELPQGLILLTTWEADVLPQRYIEALNRVREVWVPSRFNADTFRRQIARPVFQIPHPVHAPFSFRAERSAIEKGLALKETDFVFLNVGTWQERKNLGGVIEAFLRAFPDEPNVLLVLKTGFGFVDERQACAQISEAIRRASAGHRSEVETRIRVCQGFWPEEHMTALLQRADCYVSLHRGEGWCYPLFDAACNGIPVVATAYSGPVDYLDPRYHNLVRYELTPARIGSQEKAASVPFSQEMSWAEPDALHAASLMREVYERKRESLERAALGAEALRGKYSLLAVGEMAKRRLLELDGESLKG